MAKCHGCNAVPAYGVRLLCCPLCVEQRLAQPAQFCSKECFSQVWKSHKRWHAEVVLQWKGTAEEVAVCTEARTNFIAKSHTKYEDICGRALEASARDDHKASVKLLKRAIKLNRRPYLAYSLIARAYRDCEAYGKALPYYLMVRKASVTLALYSRISDESLAPRRWGAKERRLLSV